MKIIKLKSENIKKIKAVEMKFDENDNLIFITGKNAQGKSSILDSIFWALGGKKAIQEKPIRDGQEKAEIEIELDDYIVNRTFTEKDSYLKVTSKDGAKYSNPQEFIDAVIGKLSFDPLEFIRMDSKKQIQTLIDITGLDFEKIEEDKKKLIDSRLDVGREIKSFPSYKEEDLKMAKEITNKEVEKPSDLVARYQKAMDEKNEYDNAQKRIKEIEAELKNLKSIKEPKEDPEKLKSEIENIQEKQDQFNANKKIVDDVEKIKALKLRYESLTDKIKKLDDQKESQLKKVKMPIEGLGWTEDGVIYENNPIEQTSGAEQLKISMAIAVASNPNLKIILIRDGSLLDKDNIAVIKRVAEENNFQVFIESVDDSGKVGFYIEEGEVKNINK